jgi:RimJ/RimL family protein N-acetyltransferase
VTPSVDEPTRKPSRWRKAWTFVMRGITSHEVTSRLQKLEETIDLATRDRYQAAVDAEEAAAVYELLASLSDTAEASLLVGSLLVVKYQGPRGPTVLVRTLTRDEMDTLRRYPMIQSSPHDAVSVLARVMTAETLTGAGGWESPLPVLEGHRHAADVPRVRVLGTDDWELLRSLRLQALRESPRAFHSTHADALRRTEAEWRAWPTGGAAFAAWLAGDAVGMVGVVRRTDEPHLSDLIAMWVDPVARGSGAADALVRAVLAWAADAGCAAVHLEVVPGNLRARRVYARLGFVEVDAPTTVDGGIAMRCELSGSYT